MTLLGATGQVATELQRRVPTGVTVTCLSRKDADFAHPGSVVDAVAATDFDLVVNAVAYTAVDRAEEEKDLAFLVNHRSVEALSAALAERDKPLVHLSTDYVFDGSGTAPWRPDDPKGPLNTYGASKLAGEEAIRAASCRHAIIRTSWVFSAHGNNFVKSMLRLGNERDTLTIVADQVGGPTAAHSIADAVYAVCEGLYTGAPSGTHHFSGTGDASWADFAREIFLQTGTHCNVVDIPTTDYPTPARRPLNSRLDCESLRATFDVSRPDWRSDLTMVLKELT